MRFFSSFYVLLDRQSTRRLICVVVSKTVRAKYYAQCVHYIPGEEVIKLKASNDNMLLILTGLS